MNTFLLYDIITSMIPVFCEYQNGKPGKVVNFPVLSFMDWILLFV